MPWHGVRPCAVRSSPCPHGSPDHNADRRCTYPSTGPGPNSGPRSGATCSRRPPDHRPPPEPRPTAAQARPENQVEKLGTPAGPRCPPTANHRSPTLRPPTSAAPRIEAYPLQSARPGRTPASRLPKWPSSAAGSNSDVSATGCAPHPVQTDTRADELWSRLSTRRCTWGEVPPGRARRCQEA